MSGGSLEYVSFKIQSAWEMMDEWMDRNTPPDDTPPEVIDELEVIQELLAICAMKAHAAEWYMSGDYGDESFLEVIRGIDAGKWDRPFDPPPKEEPC
jgi:hypothetical protein